MNALKTEQDRSRRTIFNVVNSFINYIRMQEPRYHNIAIRSVVKRFDRRDALDATIAFASAKTSSGYANVVAEWRAEDSAGGPQSRDKVTAGSTLPNLSPQTPSSPARSLLPRSNEIFRNIAFECD